MDNYQKDVLNLCRYLYYMHAECNNQTFCWFYLQNEACFYECDPILGHFQPPGTEALDSVPVCASYCNSWFEACRNDMTCTDNWLLLYLNTSVDTCPQSECRTFEEWFDNGRDFCNTIWDTGYFYSEQEDNCTIFTFDVGMPNPNSQLSFPVRDGAERELSSAVIIIGVLAMVLLSPL